ncbi:hypothetical protein BA768_12190 [Chryseobacterium sp. CBo1]|uniref:hypothetical protein n=1 Tax=Chryseobacterium sp. CBo1 TaxID=1869230 RepID=UPI0008103FFE|nr:hypothetical protein [Chryseobacterium sp. CBo1]OCK52347.1 hypothetical protein BA768_12190 [Chryseobacterium sp. CBo1]
MEKENLKQIEQYLKSKNLSSAIFTEVYDHFVMQISDFMLKKEVGFQEAFVHTTINWQSELKMVRADIFSFRRIAKIEKNLLQMRFRKMMLLAFLFCLLSGMMFYLNEDLYLVIQGCFIILHLLFLLYSFIFGKLSFSDYQRISFHPLLLRSLLLILIIVPILNIAFKTHDNIWEFPLNHMALTFSVVLQIQLLYYRIKKVNILLS